MGIVHSIILLIVFITFTYQSGPEMESFHPYEEEEVDPRYEEFQLEEEEAGVELEESYEEDDYYSEEYSEEQVSEI